jgi:hypothetical protein
MVLARLYIEGRIIAKPRPSGCYFVVAMTVDRYLAICQPHRFQGLRTPRMALKVGAGVMLVFGTYSLPYLYTADFINGFCAGKRLGYKKN